jgi:hypothetical protein
MENQGSIRVAGILPAIRGRDALDTIVIVFRILSSVIYYPEFLFSNRPKYKQKKQPAFSAGCVLTQSNKL